MDKLIQIVLCGYTVKGHHRVVYHSDCIYGSLESAESALPEYIQRNCCPLGPHDESYLDEKTLAVDYVELKYRP